MLSNLRVIILDFNSSLICLIFSCSFFLLIFSLILNEKFKYSGFFTLLLISIHPVIGLWILSILIISLIINNNKKIRVGGMVKEDSIKMDQNTVNFVITDFKNEINVTYSGAIPNLFAEGKGVVAEGFLNDRNYLKAKKILAKHDENYMPPEVKEALEKKN